MLSLINISLIYLIFLIDNRDLQNNDDSIYSIFAGSLFLGLATNGLLGLVLTLLKLTYLPLFIPLSFISIFLFIREKSRKNIYLFFLQFYNDFKIIYKLYKNKIFLKIIFIFIFLMLMISIGPINHSDAANAYVGIPYKFWLNNSHFFDGNLNQGLLGIGDFSNIFYFQEKTSWFIRFTQFLTVIPILFLILKRGTSSFIVLIIFSSPVFIQWLTIGKTNFLSDSCLAIVFLVWEKNRNNRDLILLLSISFLSISFKVSALLVCIPIYLFLIYFYKDRLFDINGADLKRISLIWPLLLSLSCLITILIYRFSITGNPFYPLFAEIFTPENQQLVDWEILLKNWNRSNLFQFWLFFPKSFGKISFVLGPANLLILIYTFINVFKEKKLQSKSNIFIGLAQFFMLFLFAQGRADYYVSPLMLTYTGINKIDYKKFNILPSLIKNFNSLILSIQVSMFLISSFYMIFINFYIVTNYEKGMEKFAWNYYNSKIIKEKAALPVMSESTGMTHLYFKDEFISNNNFNKCFFYNENSMIKNKYEHCVKTLGISTIIVDKDKLSSNDKFTCERNKLKRVSRNIFLTRKKEVDFCYLTQMK